MSERHKPHNGRDLSGHFKVKQVDLEELTLDPEADKIIRDDVRLGGAVEDVGMNAAEPAKHISDLVRENRSQHGPQSE